VTSEIPKQVTVVIYVC